MSAALNKVQLIGNLGAKPELKHIPSGQGVCEMRIATNESWTKDGQKHEAVEWHRVVAWGKLGENCAQYLDKGRQIYVEGKLKTRRWEDKGTGKTCYATEIVASDVKFFGGKAGDTRPSQGKGMDDPPPSSKDEDDIPF